MAGIVLTTNPTTITGTVTVASGYAVYGPGTTAWTLVNAGTIQGQSAGVLLNQYGTVTNNAGAVIGGQTYGVDTNIGNVTVINSGLITAATGVRLARGSVTNASGGTISGSVDGVKIAYGPVATVVNSGLILGGKTTGDAGAYIRYGGVVSNGFGGTIAGYDGVLARQGAVTLTNDGAIVGSLFGAALLGGGSITNLAGATITGFEGIVIQGDSATVVNAGTITGTMGNALVFQDSTHDLVVLVPGAVFGGAVLPGNYSTLELAASLTPGTLSGLGAANGIGPFATVTEDLGANWTLTGHNYLAAGDVFTANGALTNTGTLANAGTLTANSSLVNSGTVTGNPVYLGAGVSLTNLKGGSLPGVADHVGAGTVSNDGKISRPGSYGLDLRYGGSVTNMAGATIAGAFGVGALIATGSSPLALTNAGVILGTTGNGVLIGAVGTVDNEAGGTISGYFDGIRLDPGSGTAEVLNAGTIATTGTAGEAIYFGGASALLTVDPGAVFGGIVNGGTGASTLELAVGNGTQGTLAIGQIVNFGSVVEDQGASWVLTGSQTFVNGVTLENGSSLTVAAGAVLAAANAHAIYASSASGKQFLDNAGTITAPAGIELRGTLAGRFVNSGLIAATDAAQYPTALYLGGTEDRLTNTASGTISGVLAGVSAAYGATIVNYGTITASGLEGLFDSAGSVVNKSTGTIRGDSYGVYIGAATITNAGSIVGPIAGVVIDGGGTLVNQAGGLILGADQGVIVRYGAGRVTNAGGIGALNAPGVGVLFRYSAGTLVNEKGGAIGGGFAGVEITGSLAAGIVNRGAIYGQTTYAVDIAGTAGGSLVNFGMITTGTASGKAVLLFGGRVENEKGGTISGPTDGIQLDAKLPSTIVNAGLISGGINGVLLQGLAANLTNRGTITANDYAVSVGTTNPTIANEKGGMISAGGDGVIALYPATVANGGSIHGGNNGIELFAGGDVTNAISGTITGYSGVFAYKTATVINSGAITGANSGVHLVTGTLDNGAKGRISGARLGVIFTETGTVANMGVIEAGGGEGISLEAGGVVGNAAGAVVTGKYDGIAAYGTSTITNAGSIGSGGIGVLFSGTSGTTVTLVNAAGATIAGAKTGVFAGYPATLSNSGLITGGSFEGLFFGSGTLANEKGAVISGGTFGAYTDTGIVTNGGRITATIGAGVFVYNTGSLLNLATGVVTGGTAGVELMAGGLVSNAAGGLISGRTGVLGGGGADTVINAGTIAAAAKPGVAVNLGGGNDLLVIDPGAVFVGSVRGGAGSDTLELAAGGTTGALAGLGRRIAGFERVTVDAGASWRFDGNNTLAKNGILTNGGTVEAKNGTLFLPRLVNDGTVLAQGATIVVEARVTATKGDTGMLEIGARSTLDLANGAAASQTVDFLAPTGRLGLAAGGGRFAAPITGFAHGDIVTITGTTLTRLGVKEGPTQTVVRALDGATLVETLVFKGDYRGARFALSADPKGGFDITDPPRGLAAFAATRRYG